MGRDNGPQLEVCVDTASGIVACQADADRIELCSALGAGGLTPSPGLITQARKSGVPVHVMIRPRAGDFDFDAADLAVCEADIHHVKAAGLAGVVLGVARGGGLDDAALTRLIAAAGGQLDCTLHRVIDTLDDPVAAVEHAIALGFRRILTSGGEAAAIDGVARLRTMNAAANGRIEVMAGSGVTPQRVAPIASATGIRSFHGSCRGAVPQAAGAQRLGFASATRPTTDPLAVKAMKEAVRALA